MQSARQPAQLRDAQPRLQSPVDGAAQQGRPVAAVAPGVSGATGLSLQQLAGALVRELRPSALLCVDSLCSSEPERLGRTLQFSDTGLHPAQPDHSRHLDAARLGVPVLAAGIPTLMQAEEGRDLVVTPRDLDGVIAHGAALLGAAINRALQPKLSVAQLCWLAEQFIGKVSFPHFASPIRLNFRIWALFPPKRYQKYGKMKNF